MFSYLTLIILELNDRINSELDTGLVICGLIELLAEILLLGALFSGKC